MKKFLLVMFMLLISSTQVFADDLATAKSLFNQYVYAANTYSPNLLSYYSPRAKIIRQVVKPDGTTVNATTNMQTYAQQLKLSQGTAKLRKYVSEGGKGTKDGTSWSNEG